MKLAQHWLDAKHATQTFVSDVGRGMLVVSHNTLALFGLLTIAAALLAFGREDVRTSVEQWAYGWLHERHGTADAPAGDDAATSSGTGPLLMADASAAQRATAVDKSDLSKHQAAVAQWISRRYKVAPEPIGRLVQEAWQVGGRTGVEPTLILAIMAVESSFNPFAQSSVGAQGLMQVMTRVHDKKYEAFGGTHAAFDPVSNLRVGVQVLKECIARAGSVYDGLRHYVGAANLPTDGGYASKVLGEQRHLNDVVAGKPVAAHAPITPVAAPAKAPQGAAVQTSAMRDVATATKPPSSSNVGEPLSSLHHDIGVANDAAMSLAKGRSEASADASP
jgi:hypothetical protein